MKTDAQIQRDVLDELSWEPQIKASEIGVASKNHIVTLSGTVNNYLIKQQAEKAAFCIAGVHGVANDIQVKLVNSDQKNDADLAEASVHALRWNTIVPDDKIKVSVDHGWVTLSGDLEWQYQKQAAYKAVENLTGVLGVINKLSVKPIISTIDVKNRIANAFQRNASLESKNINVEVKGEKVILSGMLPSFHDREEAVRAAWAAPGIFDVDNRIIIAEPVMADMEE